MVRRIYGLQETLTNDFIGTQTDDREPSAIHINAGPRFIATPDRLWQQGERSELFSSTDPGGGHECFEADMKESSELSCLNNRFEQNGSTATHRRLQRILASLCAVA